jgi:hypothetical protein
MKRIETTTGVQHGQMSCNHRPEESTVSKADMVLAKQCVQRRLACSMRVSLIGARVRSLVTGGAFVEETKRMKPTDKAIVRMASESPGRNASEPSGGLDKKNSSGGRAPCFGAKAT